MHKQTTFKRQIIDVRTYPPQWLPQYPWILKNRVDFAFLSLSRVWRHKIPAFDWLLLPTGLFANCNNSKILTNESNSVNNSGVINNQTRLIYFYLKEPYFKVKWMEKLYAIISKQLPKFTIRKSDSQIYCKNDDKLYFYSKSAWNVLLPKD